MLNFLNTAIAAARRDRRRGAAWHDGRRRAAPLWFEFSRPFTLVAPALGFASGAVTAAGAAPREAWSSDLLLYPVIGLTMAAVLNAASNALNQIYDLEIDRINKPKRPLPSGRLSIARRVDVHAGRLRRRADAGVAGRAGRPARVLLDRARRHGDHRSLFGAALPHQAAAASGPT